MLYYYRILNSERLDEYLLEFFRWDIFFFPIHVYMFSTNFLYFNTVCVVFLRGYDRFLGSLAYSPPAFSSMAEQPVECKHLKSNNDGLAPKLAEFDKLIHYDDIVTIPYR